MYRKHGVNVDDSAAECPTAGSDIDDASVQHSPEEASVEHPVESVDNSEDPQPTASTSDNQRAAALFILKAREERMLTQNAMNGLLKDVTGCLYTLA